MSTLLVALLALALLAGCAPRYAYHSDPHVVHYDTNGAGKVKGYMLSDGSYVKVNPAFGTPKVIRVQGKKKRGR